MISQKQLLYDFDIIIDTKPKIYNTNVKELLQIIRWIQDIASDYDIYNLLSMSDDAHKLFGYSPITNIK